MAIAITLLTLSVICIIRLFSDNTPDIEYDWLNDEIIH
jgi:hypothetical protein